MLCKLWVLALCACVALSAPTVSFAPGAAERPEEMKILSDYFQMLASKIQAGRQMAQAPVCNLANAKMPVASPTPLPGPAAGLVLKHVAIGRGTQNYTCGTNATAAPAAIGAVATLFNASCIAATYPDLLTAIPNVALQVNLTNANQNSLTPSNLIISGHHFFTTTTTPFFDLDTSSMQLGTAPCSKNATVPAPAGAPAGQGGKGNGAVAWLKLTTKDGATGNLEEVYRLNTAGGNPPATCTGILNTSFEVEYSAEYWFWESKP